MQFYFALFQLCISITRLTSLMDRASTKSGRCQLVSLDFWHNIQTCDVTFEGQEARLWWPHQAKEPTLSTLLKVICVNFDLCGSAYSSTCSPSHQVNGKQTKFTLDKQLQQTCSLHRWSWESDSLSVYQEESDHSSGEQLMREAGVKQLPELQFCLCIPWRRTRKWLLRHG